jgi:hypothetical protein
VAPGAVLTDYVGLTNLANKPLTLRLYASDAFNTSTGGFDLLPGNTRPKDVGSWVSVKERRVTIPARRRLDIPFTLRVPADATPGDHAGGIVTSLIATGRTAAGDKVTVDNRVGARLYLRVAGPLRPAVTVAQLDTAYTGTANPIGTGTVDLAYTVRNTGNVRLSGRLATRVEAPFGVTLKTTDLGVLPELLPGNSFTGTARVSQVVPVLRLGTKLTVNGTSLPGASTSSTTGDGVALTPIVRASSVWAMPWNLLTILVVAAAILVTLLRRRRARPESVESVTAEPVPQNTLL